MCARTYDELVFDLPRGLHHTGDAVDMDMPIGGFSDFSVEPTCGLVSATGLIGFMDDPSAFYEPDRLNAQLLWFRVGFVEYRFPNRVPPGARIDSFQLTAEICSEAPLHHLDWPSDIGVWVNGVFLGEWTCPSDFGGQRGRLTPSWWEEKDSQFGVLKRWLVTGRGTTIDGINLSTVDLDAVGLCRARPSSSGSASAPMPRTSAGSTCSAVDSATTHRISVFGSNTTPVGRATAEPGGLVVSG